MQLAFTAFTASQFIFCCINAYFLLNQCLFLSSSIIICYCIIVYTILHQCLLITTSQMCSDMCYCINAYLLLHQCLFLIASILEDNVQRCRLWRLSQEAYGNICWSRCIFAWIQEGKCTSKITTEYASAKYLVKILLISQSGSKFDEKV